MKLRWDLVAVAYLGLAALGGGLSRWVHGGNPLQHPAPAMELGPVQRHLLSLVIGVAVALVVVAATRLAVPRARWARALHAELRPVAEGMSGPTILAVALSSSLGEELLFRSLLTPWAGVWVQGLVFGVLHQTRGSSRWAWMGWATGIGLVLGWLYVGTGSLAGPLAAHFLINAVNLQYLRDHDPSASGSFS